MPWSGEVISHAVILSCPVAACYAARVLSKLSANPEDRSSFLARQRLLPLTFRQPPTESKRFRQGEEVLQYSNATFSFETSRADETSADGEDDDLEFFMMTPQQAQGALGDHATQFKKIYINGLTFIEQSDEQGTVVDSLSLDEYACRIRSVVTGAPHDPTSSSSSSPSGCSSPCLSPAAVDCYHQLEKQASYGTAASIASTSSCRSIAASSINSLYSVSTEMTGAVSRRNSLDEPYGSSCSSYGTYSSALYSAASSGSVWQQKGDTEWAGCAAAFSGGRQSLPQVPCPTPSHPHAHSHSHSHSHQTACGCEGLPSAFGLRHAQTWPVVPVVPEEPAEEEAEAVAFVRPCISATQLTTTPTTTTRSCAARPTGPKASCSCSTTIRRATSGGSASRRSSSSVAGSDLRQQQSCLGRRDVSEEVAFGRRRSASLSSSSAERLSSSAFSRSAAAGLDKAAAKRRGPSSSAGGAGVATAPPPLPTPDPLSAALLAHVEPAASRPTVASVTPSGCATCVLRHAASPQVDQIFDHTRGCVSAAGASPPCVPQASRQRSGAQAMYPRTTQGGATPTTVQPATSPAVGLSKAPALPLPVPDGSSDAIDVPPALRYYLAQARAAGAGADGGVAGAVAAGGPLSSSSSGSAQQGCAHGLSGTGAAAAGDLAASQPGFVRAAVEQFNTQRLLRCHVTPFAAAKTSRTPRALTPPQGSPVACK